MVDNKLSCVIAFDASWNASFSASGSSSRCFLIAISSAGLARAVPGGSGLLTADVRLVDETRVDGGDESDGCVTRLRSRSLLK